MVAMALAVHVLTLASLILVRVTKVVLECTLTFITPHYALSTLTSQLIWMK